jgi:hypothetical protein
MSKEFDPAPHDKHAEDPKQAAEADKKHKKLEKSLEDTFPASDRLAKLNRSRPRIDCRLKVACHSTVWMFVLA